MKDKKQRRNYLWPCIYGAVLSAYAVFTLLDSFVIPKNVISMDDIAQNTTTTATSEPEQAPVTSAPPEDTEKTEETEEQTEEVTTELTTTEPVIVEPIITENSYISEDFSITITELVRFDTHVFVADIVLKNPTYLRAGLAQNSFGRNIKEATSVIAEANNAILAINGDYYGFRDQGFVMRNGYLYRDSRRWGDGYEDLVIYGNGKLEIFPEASAEASDFVAGGAVQIFSFGPGLVQSGEITVGMYQEVDLALVSNPRTAIGEIEPLHYLFVVSDGRTAESSGLTLYQLAQVMQELNCHTAYNLDGGGSSTMWFMGRIVNNPTDGSWFGERRVSDIVYIG